jgi:hypothetical protein
MRFNTFLLLALETSAMSSAPNGGCPLLPAETAPALQPRLGLTKRFYEFGTLLANRPARARRQYPTEHADRCVR